MSYRYREQAKPNVRKLKEMAGEIPSETCPDIDKIISMVDVGDDEKIDSAAVILKLEELRKCNAKLRELGKFWYEQCEEMDSFYEGYVDEKLAEQKDDLNYEHEQALISLERSLSK
jgi:hypothetical protein